MTGVLSKFELDYLSGKVQLKGKDAVNARYRIKKKIKHLVYLELPLLLDYQQRTSSPLVEIEEILKGCVKVPTPEKFLHH